MFSSRSSILAAIFEPTPPSMGGLGPGGVSCVAFNNTANVTIAKILPRIIAMAPYLWIFPLKLIILTYRITYTD